MYIHMYIHICLTDYNTIQDPTYYCPTVMGYIAYVYALQTQCMFCVL